MLIHGKSMDRSKLIQFFFFFFFFFFFIIIIIDVYQLTTVKLLMSIN